MRVHPGILLMAALPLMAGCSAVTNAVDDFRSDRTYGRTIAGKQNIPPGLEPLYRGQGPAEPPPPPPPEEPYRPVPPRVELLPFPPSQLNMAEAERLLANDPAALRFLALRQLTESGVVTPDEARPRKETNMGALLPLTTRLPPAAGLDRPIPPFHQLEGRLAALAAPPGKGGAQSGEWIFLMDGLLPKLPAERQKLSPPDLVSARMVRDRLARLEEAGLITPQQRAEETIALDQLMAGGTLPEMLEPPKPPEPPKKQKKASGRGSRFPGGVSGKLEVVPSPAGVDAPKLPPAFKGPAGAHLLSMGSVTHGEKAWDALKKEHPELAELSYRVARADLGALGVTYRLIAGPLDTAQAELLCIALKTKGQTCTPTPFPPTPAQ